MRKDSAVEVIQKIKSLPAKQQRALIQLLKKQGVDLSSLDMIPQRATPSDGKVPLSFGQQRLWFLAKLDGNSAHYSVPMALRLSGRLDRQALIRALRALVERHEALRTRFVEEEGVAWQHIDDAGGFVVSEEQLTPGESLRALCEAEALTPFDLARDSLIRVRLLREAETEHILLVTLHHTICDGWSLSIFFRELVALYRGFCNGEVAPLEPLPIQYADYAEWQRQWLVDGVQERQLQYWKQKLAGIDAQLSLPTDRPRPAVKSYHGAHERFTCPPELAQALRALSKQHDTTLYMTLLAAYALLLERYTQQTDIAIGTPIANRNRAELEGLIGLFVNTLAIRADLAGDPTFVELLGRVKATALEAYGHQDVPFEAVVDALQLERSLSFSPVFQTVFVLQEGQSEDEVRLGELALSFVDSDYKVTKFDLTLEMRETPSGLAGSVEYNTDLFDRATIQRLIGHYTRLLERLTADPQRKISEYDFLDVVERHRLLEAWNPFTPSTQPAQCVHELFEAQAEKTPHSTAVICEDQRLTYAELNRKANQVAHYLRARGVGCDTLVGLCVERSLELVVGILGIIKAGGAYVPIDPGYPPERIRFMLEDSAVGLVLTQSQLVPQLPLEERSVVLLDSDGDAAGNVGIISRQPTDNLAPDAIGLQLQNLLYVIYTSGSTGRPKGVLVQHDHVVRLFHSTAEKFGFGERDVWTLFHSFAFDFSVWELWGALIYGGTLIVVPKAIAQSPPDFYRLLLERRVTVLNQTPSAFELLVAVDQQERGELALRTVVFGGEALNPAILTPWFARHDDERVQMINMYGITETTVHVTFKRLRAAGGAANQKSLVGRKLPDLTLYVLDQKLAPVPIGVAGEMYVGGAGVARGYLDRPELTAARFIENPFPGRADTRLYKTGDLARWLPDGDLEFIGRADNQVKIRGFRIEIGEIETQLSSCPLVRSCVVLVREDQPGNKQLVAYVVLNEAPNEGPAESHAALTRYLQQLLPDYMIPSAFVPLAALPLTSNGKVDRRALPAPDSSAYAFEDYVAPTTDTEKRVAAAWASLLGLEPSRISTRDNFFALGGHSLLITVLVARLKEQGFEITVRGVFSSPTLADLAAELEANRASDGYIVPPNRIPAGATAITPEMLPLAELSAQELESLVAGVPGGAANVQDIYPLVPSQQGILFHGLMDPANDPYIIPMLLSVPDRARYEQFVAALRALIARHDVMRTAVVSAGLASPVQVVYRQAELPIEVLTFDPARDGEEQARALLDRPRAMALDRGPLVQLKVAADPGSTRRFILMNLHHLIEDATALRLIFEELLAHMAGRLELLTPPVPYRDFVAHTLHQLRVNDVEGFFSQKLGDVSECTAPFGLRNVHGDGRTIRDLRRSLPPELAGDLRRLAQELRISPASVFHAAWALVVGACSRRDDVVFGTVLSGRLQGVRGVERMLGNFINTLPLRVPIAGRTVEQLILETDAALKELIQYEQSSLIVAQSCSGVGAGAPLFSSMVNFRHFEPGPARAVDPEELGLRWLGAVDRTNYPMGLSIDDAGSEFSLNVQVDSSLSPEAVLGYMETALARMVEAVRMRDGATLAAHVDVMPAAERQRLLVTWNDTAKPYPHERCLFELFDAAVARGPERVAVAHGDRQLTYGELDARANQVARRLRQLGVGPDVLVGLRADRSLETIVALIGILKAGGAYVPIDPAYPLERTRYMLESAGIAILLSQSHLPSPLEDRQIEVIDLDTGRRRSDQRDVLGEQPRENLDPASIGLTPSHLAYVIFTSGSTGRPKGVLVEQRGVVRLACNPDYFPSDEHTIGLHHSSISFDVGSQEVLLPLLNGGKLVLHAGDSRDVRQLVDSIELGGVNMLALSAAFLPAFVEACEQRRLPLEYMGIGGEAFSSQHVRQLYARHPQLTIVNAYGPTENSVASTCYVIPRDIADVTIPIGRPIAQSTAYVLDEQLRLLPSGVVGELCVGGSGVARGYLNSAALTKQRFVPDPFSDNRADRLYRTGDLARWLPDGNLEFVGRIDNQVKVRGFRVELGEIESALMAHPEVKSAVVTASAGSGGRSLVAYVCPTSAYLEEGGEALEAENVGQWTRLFDDQYADTPAVDRHGSGASLVGWNSSYSGSAIAQEQMEEWVAGTVARIERMRPRRLLEIGCGSGLLLLRYAGACEAVHMTDFSATALAGVRDEVHRRGWSHVTSARAEAVDVSSLAGKTFDTIVINSVVQYFPNRRYLERVIHELLPFLDEGGRILLGDVRNLDLFDGHLCAIEGSRLTSKTTAAALATQVRRRAQQETELLVSPSFFAQLAGPGRAIGRADILVKRGTGDNEMLSYRYDVVLTKGRASDAAETVEWHEATTLAQIRSLIDSGHHHRFGVAGVSNPRIEDDLALDHGLKHWPASRVILPRDEASRWSASARERMEELEALFRYAEALGYACEATWSQDRVGDLDLLFSRDGWPCVQARSPYRQAYLTNHPQIARVGSALSKRLKEELSPHLPEYMIPSVFVVMEALPLTTNGKVDKEALPQPDEADVGKERYVAPRSPTEIALCELIQEILGLTRIGIQDGFFALGGHSLLATRLSSRVKQRLGKELSLRAILEGATIEQLAAGLDGAMAQAAPSLLPLPGAAGPAPISFQQEELWFLNRAAHLASSHDNVQISYRLTGPLNRQLYQRCCRAIIERHALLRTSFAVGADGVFQTVNDAGDFAVSMEQVPDEVAVEELLAAEQARPFLPSDRYMIRIHLLALSQSEHVAVITRPWGIFDGASTGLFFAELEALYCAFSRDAEATLPSLPVQYADFARWQRANSGATIARQRAYWQEQLRGLPTHLRLKSDYARPAVKSHRGAAVAVTIASDLHQQLVRLSQQQGATLYMTLLSAFAVLIARHAEETDIAIGSPTTNRPQPELDPVIGFFVNLLTMRLKVSPELRFVELLAQARRTTTEAYENKDIPFKEVVAALGVEGDASRSPLFQVLFNLVQAAGSGEPSSELGASRIKLETKVARFDLSLVLEESASGLRGQLEYSTDLFPRRTIEKMVARYLELLRGIVARPDLSLAQLGQPRSVATSAGESSLAV